MTANPYRAPAMDDVDHDVFRIELATGEWRIFQDMLLVAGDVELPDVCVHTGVQSRLSRRTVTAWYVPGFGEFVEITLAMMLVGATFVAWWIGAFVFRLAMDTAMIMPAVVVMSFSGIRRSTLNLTGIPVQVQFSESETFQHQHRKKIRRRWQVALSCGAACFLAVWYFLGTTIVLPIIIVTIAVVADRRAAYVQRLEGSNYFITGVPVAHLYDFESLTEETTKSP